MEKLRTEPLLKLFKQTLERIHRSGRGILTKAQQTSENLEFIKAPRSVYNKPLNYLGIDLVALLNLLQHLLFNSIQPDLDHLHFSNSIRSSFSVIASRQNFEIFQ